MSNNKVDYLLRCTKCNKPFFTMGEKAYYEEKGYTFPHLCKKCRNRKKFNYMKKMNYAYSSKQQAKTNTMVNLYQEIVSNWSVEAKKENLSYFYNVDELQSILDGKKAFVIGRKGSGKTSIAQHLVSQKRYDIFCQPLSFKNFPFNILYGLNNRDYTEPNQYISIWKYLIISYICKKMISNNNIDESIRNQLGKIYGDNPEKSLKMVIGKWTSKNFGIQVMGSGIQYGGERQESKLPWLDTSEILENVIKKYCDDSYYYIVFDELDEDYKDFSSEKEEREYKCMLTSLFKAVQDIRSTFDDLEMHIYPVVFLRSDIYNQLTDSDKNKWRESIVDMEWNTSKIQQMLAHRLCVAIDCEETDFNNIWFKVFENTKVKMGNRQGRDISIYKYIERSTEMRPRDFVQYIKVCAQLSLERGEKLISPKTVKDADESFSDYLYAETIDELFAVIPEIREILGLLSTIRKQSFKYSTFEQEYNNLVEQGKIPARDVKWILLKLFDAGVIGNQPTMKNQSVFRFSNKSPRFNYNEPMLVHRGLFKALQIF